MKLLLITFLFLPSLANASIVRIQSAKNSTSGTSVVVTLGATPSDGNFLVASIGTSATSSGQVSSISQTGATWVKAIDVANGSGSEGEIWYAENVSGAGTGVTINFGASSTLGVIVVEYSGIAKSSSFDVSASSVGTLSVGNPFSGTTVTTNQSEELWFASFSHTTVSTFGTDFSSLSNSFTIIDQTLPVGVSRDAAGENISSVTGTASTMASYPGIPITDVWAGLISTFKGSVVISTPQLMTEMGIGG